MQTGAVRVRVVAVAAALVAVVAGLAIRPADFMASTKNVEVSAAEVLPLATEAARPAVRLNAGGPAQTVGGVTWEACGAASRCSGWVAGGFPYAVSPPPTVSGVTAPANAALYQTEWTGGATNGVPAGAVAAAFTIAVPDGAYHVRLHFAEIVQSRAGARRFDVDVEGRRVLADFDVYAEAGGKNRAIVRSFPVTVDDGDVTIDFLRRVENVKVSSIEVVPAATAAAPSPSSRPSAAPFAWRTEAPAPLQRFEAGGAAVGGKLYVLGGYTTGDIRSTARSDVYDPATGTWRRIADMPVQVTHAPAVVVDSEIWLVGGFVGNHPGPSTSDVWIYSTAANTWRRGASLPQRRGAGGAGLVGRTIYAFGGVDRAAGSNEYIDEAEHWALDLDAPNRGWQRRADLPLPRNHLGSGALDGAVYAVSGQLGGDEASGNRREVHRYDPPTDRWTRVADLPVPRGHTTASVFPFQGRLVVMGGTRNGNTPAPDVHAYDPGTNRWQALPSMPAGRKTPVAGVINGRFVVSTGSGGGPTTTTWSGNARVALSAQVSARPSATSRVAAAASLSCSVP